ncbi:MFS general substrate transporter [Gloeophyllum trabeum ATCC 11539]|uniref:MFS general substrate transporter n=1 Tax=Gloeophyllum trabeum (strain ATCC 11539 / FP-39264 / Madison 617) TaxID=670483 RepID=S7Q7N8_GLOTA|nr:MFS general substrate transporter [Gloeophyllum trabeum ATCC 11539]EPQ55542.1 MFS general substrate transporter [Gloeophyllum trabeum ATCC 11539]
MAIGKKWLIVLVISSSALCVTCASSIASFSETGIAQSFHVSREVTILSISLFVEGLGIGPLLVGPLSEVYGRNIVYRVSYLLFFAFTWPIVFAPNIAVFLVFRFITGFCGSAFLSVAGGSVSDLFDNRSVANPMAVYTMSPFIGPVLGPLVSGFINQNVNWRWTYRVLIMWIFVQTFALYILVPETYEPVLTKRKAARLRKSTGDQNYYAPLDKKDVSVWKSIEVSCYKPFQLLLYDRMALLLDTWNALILGILYLAFQAFPFIFEDNHGFSPEFTGLTFLGIGIGMFNALATQSFWNSLFARKAAEYGDHPPPEIRLIMGQVGGVLAPISLFWLAFTTYPHVHWIVPIIASVPFGTAIYFIYTSTFTYLVTAYRPIAASAMASNSFLRSAFAAVFPLFATPMYNRLGTVGATALLAGLTALMAPLPFIFYRIGGRLREKSPFAA